MFQLKTWKIFYKFGRSTSGHFAGPSDKKRKFLEGKLKENLKSKKARYPFMIANAYTE